MSQLTLYNAPSRSCGRSTYGGNTEWGRPKMGLGRSLALPVLRTVSVRGSCRAVTFPCLIRVSPARLPVRGRTQSGRSAGGSVAKVGLPACGGTGRRVSRRLLGNSSPFRRSDRG